MKTHKMVLLLILPLTLLLTLGYQNCGSEGFQAVSSLSQPPADDSSSDTSPPAEEEEDSEPPVNVSLETSFVQSLSQSDMSDAYVHSTVELSNGNLVSVGRRVDMDGDEDPFIMATDSRGNHLWAREFEGGDSDQLFDIVRLDDDSVVISGLMFSFFAGNTRNGDTYLARLSSAGSILWSRNFGTADFEEGFAVTVKDQNLYVAGRSRQFDDLSLARPIVSKFDLNGDLIWSRSYNPARTSQAFREITVAPTGEIWVSGVIRDANNAAQASVLQIDENGDVVTDLGFDGDGYEAARAVIPSTNGHLIVAGIMSGGPLGGDDAFLLDYNPADGSMSTVALGTVDTDIIRGLAQDTDDKVAFVLRTTEADDQDVYFGQIQLADMTATFTRAIAQADEETTDQHPIIKLSDGGYLATLSSRSFTNGSTSLQPFFVKVSNEGEIKNGCSLVPNVTLSQQAVTFQRTTPGLVPVDYGAVVNDHTTELINTMIPLTNSLICGTAN